VNIFSRKLTASSVGLAETDQCPQTLQTEPCGSIRGKIRIPSMHKPSIVTEYSITDAVLPFRGCAWKGTSVPVQPP